jgi:predicted DNA-binding transcriptional regulator AlpA
MAPNPFDLINQELQDIKCILLELKNNSILPEKEQLMDIKEAAKFIKLSVPSLYRLCGQNKIPNLKREGKILFSEKELIEWAKKGRRKTTAEIAEEAENKLEELARNRQVHLS